MRNSTDLGFLVRVHPGLLMAWVLFAAASARAEAPPMPNSTGPGSLPSVRAEAAAEAGVVPSTSPAIRLGGFGFPMAGQPPVPQEPGRAWTVVPSIGLQLLGTDNLYQSPRDRKADLVTSIMPALLVSADTSRFRGILNYSPNIQFYANTPGQDRIDHMLNGVGLATIVPDMLFLDIRGSAGVQSITGGFAPESTVVTNRQNQVQTTSFQISPYFMHRFGDLATAQVGYAFQYVDQSTNGNANTNLTGNANSSQSSVSPNGLPSFTPQHFTANEAYAVVRSGPDLGRLALEGRASATSYIGTGVLDGAYRRIATVEGRYAIIRGVSALLEGGYEQQRYAGTPGLRIDGPVYAAGVRIDFSDESRIIAKYGRRDGFDSAYLQASLALGGRTRFSASYGERLSTSSLRAGDLLSTTSLDTLGNPIDLSTGLPIVQPFSSSFLGVQSSLMRVRSASAAIVQQWPRDTIAFTFTREERTPVSVAAGTFAYAQSGTSGAVSWGHALTERTTLSGSVQYGKFSGGFFGSGDVVSGSLTLSHQLRERLFGAVQVASSSRSDARSDDRALQNIVLVSLRQSF